VKRLGLPSRLERQLSLDRRRDRRRGHPLPRATGTRDGMTKLVRALEDHENAVAVVAPRKQAA
jgi:hypothetical protein